MLFFDILFSTIFPIVIICFVILILYSNRKKKGRKVVIIFFILYMVGKVSYSAYHSIYYPAKMTKDVEVYLVEQGYNQEDFKIVGTERNAFLGYLALVEFSDEPETYYFYRYERETISQVLHSGFAEKHVE
ncbi:hypothetical protein [Bacillus sp. FJAT-45066]|uniref:hypothetical protein n=1 Tax=Bacillus sp. FJAT-45066 TaxID=2011010 RepID=UPI000BB72EF0|nr:hypothetical protein [Bacillus sp. FJAT-45066]